jgi:hypothetical protein
MIDELEIIKAMLGDLTSVGIWGFVAYICYSLIKLGMMYAVIVWAISKALYLIQILGIAPCSKGEYDDLLRKNNDLSLQVDTVKHQYKVLKEAKDG